MKSVVTLLLGLFLASAAAFVSPSQYKTTATTTRLAAQVNHSRRHFVEAGAVALLAPLLPAWALEDLAEPTPQEKEAAEVRVVRRFGRVASIRDRRLARHDDDDDDVVVVVETFPWYIRLFLVIHGTLSMSTWWQPNSTEGGQKNCRDAEAWILVHSTASIPTRCNIVKL